MAEPETGMVAVKVGQLAAVVGGIAIISYWQRKNIVSGVDNMKASVDGQTMTNPNVMAFLHLIRVGEGTAGADGYRTLFGGNLFDSFAHHPDVKVPFGDTFSTAAGAYQINFPTWTDLVNQYGFTSFYPVNQDLAALALLKRCGALGDVIAGRFSEAIAKANKTWASLPNSPYGQPTLTMADAQGVIQSQGVKFA